MKLGFKQSNEVDLAGVVYFKGIKMIEHQIDVADMEYAKLEKNIGAISSTQKAAKEILNASGRVCLMFFKKGKMKKIASSILLFLLVTSNAYAGLELVCKGRQPQSNNKPVYVNCSERKAFVDTLGLAWKTIRQNSIGGTTEDLCWQAYQQAKDMHPSISFSNISDSFLTRCNMGLAYVK